LRRELQQQHQQLRKNYLEKLAEALVLKREPYLDTDPKYEERLTLRTAKEVKRIIRLEQKRKYYRMIGSQLSDHTDNAGGLTRKDVPLHPADLPLTSLPDPKTWKGPWRSVTDPEEIAKYVCIINTRQYNQAQATPFGSGYLADTIGLNIEHPAAAHLLNGSFVPDAGTGLLPETLRVIEYLNRPSYLNQPFPTTITTKEFQATYGVVKERASSSALGRHVGHYKAAAQDDTLSQVHSAMMILPYKMGFSPQCWHRIVDVMLEKEPGNPKLHRLRINALIESDYNQSQRILIARHLTHKLEDNNLVPDMQYGSRPGKLCIMPVLNKQLSHDIIRQTKHTVAVIENDAVGCYDRLMNPLLLLAMRQLGVTELMAKSMSLTWSHAHSVSLILNLQTGLVSPQYHCQYDDLFETMMGTQARSIQWQYKAGVTSEKPETDEDEEPNEELWEDQSFEEYYSTHESEETSQPSDLEDEENEVGRPDIYVTRSGRRSKPPERLIYDANACLIRTNEHEDEETWSEQNLLAFNASTDPETMYHHQAMKQPDREYFQEAMKKKCEAH